MNGWLSAGSEHRHLLSEFACAEPVVSGGIGKWHKPTDPAPWATTVQNLIRDLRPPLRGGKHAFVALSPCYKRVDAVVAFWSKEVSSAEQRFTFSLMARHLECVGQRMGDSAMEAFVDGCWSIIDALPKITTVYFEAQAHVNNQPINALLVRHGWTPMEFMPGDADYRVWRKTISIKNDDG